MSSSKPHYDVSLLSIVMPAYNESATIQDILAKISEIKLINNISYEIIIVNDASTDDTEIKIKEFIEQNPDMTIRLESQEVNQGKGAALHKGFELANGELTIIQDADLEYDPHEYNKLIKPILDGHADVVYGSRYRGGNPHRAMFFGHSFGNRSLTRLSNLFSNLNLTDMETCYKLFKTPIIQSLDLVEKRFGFEPEVTAKLSKLKNIAIYEVGISYYGRTFDEGKKIGWKDAIRTVYSIMKYNIFTR